MNYHGVKFGVISNPTQSTPTLPAVVVQSMCLLYYLSHTHKLTDVVLRQRESLETVEPKGDMAELSLVRLLQAEHHQVDGCTVIGCKIVVCAVVHWITGEFPHAEVSHT